MAFYFCLISSPHVLLCRLDLSKREREREREREGVLAFRKNI